MKPKSDNKIYEALMVERETRQKFKKEKPQNMTNTEYLENLMGIGSHYIKRNS
jgi:hypothetical protein